jgi:hypothetical protein
VLQLGCGIIKTRIFSIQRGINDMISRNNEPKMRYLMYTIGAILFLDIMVIITNLYIAPILEGFGLPDILIYLKALTFLILFVVISIWVKDDGYSLSKSTLRLLLWLGFSVLCIYFFSVYMYKYYLIVDVQNIIKNQILGGNPALVFDLSRINLQQLTYITTIFSGFNSEIMLFVQAMVFQALIISTKSFDIVDEPDTMYDTFMFDGKMFYISMLHVVFSFLTINLLTFRYELLSAIEIGVAVAAFAISVVNLITSSDVFKMRNNYCKQSSFVSAHRFMILLMIINIVLFTLLFGYNVYLVIIYSGTYRIGAALLALVTSIYLLIKTKSILSLENK